MWLYVPKISSPCAAVSVDSNSGYPLLDPACEPSVTWRGKPMLRASLQRAWLTKPWMKRLSGMTSPPLMVQRGVDAFLASLGDSPASLGPSQVSDSGQPMSAGSGTTSSESLMTCSLPGVSSRTSPGLSVGDCLSSSLVLPPAGSMRSGVCSARPKLGRHIDASGSTSWPTPDAGVTTRINVGGSNGRVGKERPALAALVQQWPTPAVVDTEGGRKGRSGSRSGELLLNGLAATWGTPRASDGEKGGPNMSFGAGGTPLPSQAVNWATPTVRDYKDGASPSMAAPTNGLLGRQAPRWPTPRAYSGIKSSGAARTEMLAASPLDLTTCTDGPECRKSLNPLFVEWLMGFPIGWTDFEPVVTEWSRWQRLMRIEHSGADSQPSLSQAA